MSCRVKQFSFLWQIEFCFSPSTCVLLFQPSFSLTCHLSFSRSPHTIKLHTIFHVSLYTPVEQSRIYVSPMSVEINIYMNGSRVGKGRQEKAEKRTELEMLKKMSHHSFRHSLLTATTVDGLADFLTRVRKKKLSDCA